jgi:hypothetical protein
MTRKQYADITLEVAFLIFLSKRENAPPIMMYSPCQGQLKFAPLKTAVEGGRL